MKITSTIVKRVFCVAMISMFAVVTAGCDDDSDSRDRRHARRHDRGRDHRPPPPPPPRERDKNYIGDKKRPEHHRPGKRDKYPPPRHRSYENSDIVGVYNALAINDASLPKGTNISVEIFEDEGELFLALPNGKDYLVTNDNGAYKVAGKEILEQDAGKFFYTDKQGGAWLIEKSE